MRCVLRIDAFIKLVSIGLILCTPLLNLQELLFFFGGGSNTVMAQNKVMKDIIFAVIILYSVYRLLKYRQMSRRLFLFYFILFGFVAGALFFTRDLMLFLSGMRWCIPLFLILPLSTIADEAFMRSVTRCLYYLLIVQVALQCIEFFIMPPIHGLRYPGFFVHPSAAGFFASICYVFSHLFEYKQRRVLMLVILSLFFAASTTGVAIFGVLFLLSVYYRMPRAGRLTLLFLLPLLGVLLFLNLGKLSRRTDDDIAVSGGTRMEIFKDHLTNSIFTENFGTATNTAVNMNLDRAFIADSTYASVLVNFGVTGFFVLLFMMGYLFYYALAHRKRDLLFVLLLFTLGGMPIIIFEIFPANFLFALSVAFFMRRELQGSRPLVQPAVC